MSSRGGKLAPEVNRALFVKNLSYSVTPEELFDLFGKFGPIRQVRQGISTSTKGTAFVVYEDVMDAKQACDKLNGFNFQNRYLVVLYHQPEKMMKSKEDLEARRESLAQLKKQHDSLQDKRPSMSSGRSLSPPKSASSDHKTILRKGTPLDSTINKGHVGSRAVRFVDGAPTALRSCA
ncbi:pre-mRNA branch site protein p14 [Metarhizium robertsii ARSEF 23]|uniref:Pre-mRNA branch site protein p14 n=1 Tax=Metarhizium robertsii (strain ARSEF 23 / ATCC MYA-3075) TaxID=655844 RepID=E9EVX7_METRA|nr:pre-mRNA branch site protein p14 [Metarhizium robertsii ARSEF 23]EFZ00399.2 pre-mRNA branch site protein p14 [Metarhizium robertsii ARSEF 23]